MAALLTAEELQNMLNKIKRKKGHSICPECKWVEHDPKEIVCHCDNDI